jgi:hypothetical protein
MNSNPSTTGKRKKERKDRKRRRYNGMIINTFALNWCT